jgi:peptide/nickel transport system permease protein
MALVALTEASIGNVIFAITVVETPCVVRLVRSVVLTLREQPYVDAAVTVGSGAFKIMFRHILPNTMAPLIVQATFICAQAILIEAALSFLGVGTPSEVPTWGNIISEGRLVFQIAPWNILFPGIALSLTVLSMNLLGDGLRDTLDPRLARRM